MAIDWTAHYEQLYAALGTCATLATRDSESACEVTVIDKVRGVTIADMSIVDVQGVTAACVVRKSELDDKGVDADELDEGSISFNGRCWRIQAHRHNSPDGKTTGEMYLYLTADSSQE